VRKASYYYPNPELPGRGALYVMPAKAGIQDIYYSPEKDFWIPACAGMTRGRY